MRSLRYASLFMLLSPVAARAADGNRLTYLDGNDPYYVSRRFPRLVTPQWVGEEGVDAVVVLAVDDMRDPDKYERFLRPILHRLKQIDGRAPVSIMTNQVDPAHPQLQAWLKEGLSLEAHTIDHPCPLLQKGDFARAKSTYDRCVDLLHKIPGNRPVAFRVPCCDSLNTPSPRFFAEIFKRKTADGHFLTIDSSVINLITSNDPQLPRELVLDADGQDRFRKYLPADRAFVNTVEDYPYPYVLGQLCWEFPCVMPSDWLAQHRHGPANPTTVADWKAALDAVVLKQGTFSLIFHPHGWIRSEQVIDFIDHVVARHGKRVKFLTFGEAQERLNKHLLGGQTLRGADGGNNGVRLVDLDNDGYLDVVIGNENVRQTRVWSPSAKQWTVHDFPVSLVAAPRGGKQADAGVRFGVVRPDGRPSLLVHNEQVTGAWHFNGNGWVEDKALLNGLTIDGRPIWTSQEGRDRGVRFRDLDGDGRCELIVSNDTEQAIFAWSPGRHTWEKLPFALPDGTALVTADGADAGLRLVDVDEDGRDDVVFSNEKGSSIHLFVSMKDGWAHGVPKRKVPLPPITRRGANNGVWFHSRTLWAQNEDTADQKDHVARHPFNDLLADVEPAAKASEASLHALQPRPGFQVQLMAAEPLVQSPIAFAWGPDGKFWVVEMGDYPLGLDGKGKPGGRIKVLEDPDATGRYTKATVFLDGLSFPTSVLPWGKGVVVTCAPEIFYAEDTRGTGRADRRVPLYTGFVEGNPQHRVNSLVWGLDNWLYCANGDSGGRVRSVKTGQAVDLSGRDFRIRPDDGAIDLQTGQTQYGRCRDDWGNWFGNNNSNPLYHFALADHYIRRNPHIAAPDARVPVSVTPGAAPVFPISRTLPRFNDPNAANHFTSACSAILYRDELFGPAFAGNSFVSEPVHNLVHRELVSPTGVTFTSRRATDEQQSEFLASSDNWFRPTTIQTGPDGALWVADMYRQVIEHPEWIPREWQKKLDLRAGQDKGRIYRVYPVGQAPRPIPRLDRLDAAGLVAALDSPSGWQRDVAQQLLVRGKDAASVPFLETLAAESRRPLARLHALCTLDGQGALKRDVIRSGLSDSHPGVRRHAVRLAETRLAQSPELGSALAMLTADADPQVRLQLAYTLGAWDAPEAATALGQLALRDAADPFVAAAVMSSVNRANLVGVLHAVLTGAATSPNGSVPGSLLENLLRLASAFDNAEALTTLLKAVGTPGKAGFAAWQFDALAGLLDALDQRNTPLAKLRESGPEDLRAALTHLSGLFEAARASVADSRTPGERQRLAIRILGRGLDRHQEDIAALAQLLVPQTAGDLQSAAITALGRLREPRVPELLLGGWKGYGPAQRSLTLDVLSQRDEWVEAALGAMERKEIAASELDAARRQRLLQHRAAGVRARAAKLFASAIDPDRQKVVDAYQSVLALSGDSQRGATLFAKHCATCHRLNGVGNVVGPDLASLGDKSPRALLIAVLDPNRAVEARYVNYSATTRAGLTFTGVLASETGNSITLVGPDAKQQVILRTDLEELVSSGKSAMPEGLEKELKPQDLADLIEHVRSVGPQQKAKSFEGNKPEIVQAAPDGSLLLLAANGEIYGSTLVLEKLHGNLGYWTSQDDHAIWTARVTKAGKYAVWLDWACDDASAGKKFLLQAGPNQLTGTVSSTGNWDTYRQAKVGEILLPAGQQRLTFRSAGRIFSALIDLKSIKLVPLPPE